MGRSKDIATSAKGDADYVNVSGDTMTGNLQSTELVANNAGNNTNIRLQNTASGSNAADGFLIQNATNSKVYLWNYENADVLFGTHGTERMKIDNLGRVTMPYQPAFMVIMTSAPTLTGSGTTTLPWNSEIFDVGSNYNTSNYRFTAPVDGLYYMHLHFEFHSDSSWTNSTWAYIGDYFVNGTRKTGADFWGHSGKYNLATNAAILELNANDYVDVRAVPNGNTLRYSGDSAGSFGNSRWFGYLIG